MFSETYLVLTSSIRGGTWNYVLKFQVRLIGASARLLGCLVVLQAIRDKQTNHISVTRKLPQPTTLPPYSKLTTRETAMLVAGVTMHQ
jgi:hypothetical protein